MATINDLTFAVDETIKKFPENQFSMVILRILKEGSGANKYITSTNGARSRIQNITTNEIVQIIAKELVSIYNYCTIIENLDNEITNAPNMSERLKRLNNKCPYIGEVKKFVSDFKQNNVNSILYLLSDNKRLFEALFIIEVYHYHLGEYGREVLAKYGDGTQLKNRCDTQLKAKIDADFARVSGVRNVQVNNHAVNRCVADILSGAQIRNMNNSYALDGELYATQNVGKYRKNQEDSVLIMTHPQNKSFKILVVSDGMGGGIAGEEVSNYTVKAIYNWFNNLSPEYFSRPQELQRLFNSVIESISMDMYKKYNGDSRIRAGATFTGAIVTEEETIITQIGDSRAYIVNNGGIFKKPKVSPITQDETMTWPVDLNYQRKTASEVTEQEFEDIRFAHGGNVILRCIGEPLNASQQSFRLPNNSYDKLLLMSDGASDLLDLEGIKIICKNSSWDRITDLLVQAAITKKAIRGSNWKEFYTKLVNGTLTRREVELFNQQVGVVDEEHFGEIKEGKDNTTVAGYFRR